MSTSVSRRSSAPVHPTRQQLEELDALLKRMLELPVNPLEEAAEAEEAAPPTATARSEGAPAVSPPEAMRGPHRPALTQVPETPAAAVNYQTPDAGEADLHPRVVAAAPPAENPAGTAGDWIPLTSSWRPSARTWKPLSEAWRQAQTGTGAPPSRPRGCATFRRRCRRNRNRRHPRPPRLRAWKLRTPGPGTEPGGGARPAGEIRVAATRPPGDPARPQLEAGDARRGSPDALVPLAAGRLQRGLRRLPLAVGAARPLAARADRPVVPRHSRPAVPDGRRRLGRRRMDRLDPMNPLR